MKKLFLLVLCCLILAVSVVGQGVPCIFDAPCQKNEDCGMTSSGMPIGNCNNGACLCPNAQCGNTVCEAGESSANCPVDCGSAECAQSSQCDQSVGGPCADGTGFSDGKDCYCGDSTCRDRGAFCGQGLCEEWNGENAENCPQDCGCSEGSSCGIDSDCRGGTCGASAGLCERTRNPCDTISDCPVLKLPCFRTPAGNFCESTNTPCVTDDDCPAQSNTCLTRFCERLFAGCATDADCPSSGGFCKMTPGFPTGSCIENGAPCTGDRDCPGTPDRCIGPGDKFCGRTSQTCETGADCPAIPSMCMLNPMGDGMCSANGAPCRSDLDCPSSPDTCNLIGGLCNCGQSCTDSDGDGLNNEGNSCGPIDACPQIAGRSEYQGCPVGDKNIVTLHTVTLGSKTTTVVPLEGAEVRVYDRNNADFRTIAGSKNPDGSLYGVVYEADAGRVGSCTTDVAGICFAGESQIGDYLVIVKFVDQATGKSVYVGRPKSPSDFVDTDGDSVVDLATKDFQVIKVFKGNSFFEYRAGSKLVVTGSLLEVIIPENAIWEGDSSVYPFIFSSDNEWSVDVCAQVPQGYQVVGVYNEAGNLVAASECTQVFVSGETKVVAFAVNDIGSPEPSLGATLTIKHNGKTTTKKVVASDVRKKTFVERVANAKALKAGLKRQMPRPQMLTGGVVTAAASAPQTSVLLAFGAIACIIALVIVGHKKNK